VPTPVVNPGDEPFSLGVLRSENPLEEWIQSILTASVPFLCGSGREFGQEMARRWAGPSKGGSCDKLPAVAMMMPDRMVVVHFRLGRYSRGDEKGNGSSGEQKVP